MTLTSKLIKRLENWILADNWLENQVAKHSLIGDSIFFDTEQFPWSKELEKNWQVIRSELEQVLPFVNELPNFQEISERQYKIANDDRWKTYFFYAFGYKSQKNCERCPQTAKLIEKIPGLKVAFFRFWPQVNIFLNIGVNIKV